MAEFCSKRKFADTSYFFLQIFPNKSFLTNLSFEIFLNKYFYKYLAQIFLYKRRSSWLSFVSKEDFHITLLFDFPLSHFSSDNPAKLLFSALQSESVILVFKNLEVITSCRMHKKECLIATRQFVVYIKIQIFHIC